MTGRLAAATLCGQCLAGTSASAAMMAHVVRHPELPSSETGPGLAGGALIVVAAGGAAVGAAQSDKTSAILAFAGAVLVALVTWYATDRRQRVAIDAEADRQRALFDEEA